jgi:hypothetical protein
VEDIIKALSAGLKTTFDGKTVGNGGDFGPGLTRGPFPIKCFFHQWEGITYPSIHTQILQEDAQGEPLECCGGVNVLTVDFRISVDSKLHGWSIASNLEENLRAWFCTLSGTDDLVPADATPTNSVYLVYVKVRQSVHQYDGNIYNRHVMTEFHYVRQIAGEI